MVFAIHWHESATGAHVSPQVLRYIILSWLIFFSISYRSCLLPSGVLQEPAFCLTPLQFILHKNSFTFLHNIRWMLPRNKHWLFDLSHQTHVEIQPTSASPTSLLLSRSRCTHRSSSLLCCSLRPLLPLPRACPSHEPLEPPVPPSPGWPSHLTLNDLLVDLFLVHSQP